MTDSNSAEYYRGRERQERTLAAACVNPGIASIHLDMADRYSELAGRVDRGSRLRPELRVV